MFTDYSMHIMVLYCVTGVRSSEFDAWVSLSELSGGPKPIGNDNSTSIQRYFDIHTTLFKRNGCQFSKLNILKNFLLQCVNMQT